MKKIFSIALALSVGTQLNADIYKVFWPEENMQGSAGWDAVKIVNVSSNTILDGSELLQTSDQIYSTKTELFRG